MTQPPAGPPPHGQPPFDGPQPGPVPQGGGSPPQQPGMPPQQPGNPPQPGSPAQPRNRRTGLIVGSIVGVLVVIGAIAAVLVLTLQGKTPLASDEQQVEAAIRDFYGTLSDDGLAPATKKACRADRDEMAAMSESELADAEKVEFTIDIDTVDDIVITGDRAEAKVTGKFAFAVPSEGLDEQIDDSSDESLVKEDGEWRVCSVDPTEGE